ncbi:MAG TPA: hypothetical protein P5134_03015 [Bacteroidales bacterium]|nr:hypothetical protein [Bacteroidales bacterium]
MNSIVEKGASKVALFLLALQSSFLCGLSGCALTQARLGIHATSRLSIARILSRGRYYYTDTVHFSPNLFYYHVTPSRFSNFGLDLLLQSYHLIGIYVPH